jgi:hypothetical protein
MPPNMPDFWLRRISSCMVPPGPFVKTLKKRLWAVFCGEVLHRYRLAPKRAL